MSGTSCWRVHGHLWRVREQLARGDIDAVNDEVSRFAARDTGPPHPLVLSLSSNLAAMMALVNGELDAAEQFAQTALETAKGYNDMAFRFYGALMAWTWWQRDDLPTWSRPSGPSWRNRRKNSRSCTVRWRWSTPSPATRRPRCRSSTSWPIWAGSGSGTTSRKGRPWPVAAAACGTLGKAASRHALSVYEELRPFAGTAIVLRAPAAACMGPADQYLGLLAAAMGDLALAEVHFEAALRLARRMRAKPFIVAAEVELARTLRQRGRDGDEERVAVLLRHAEESAVALGLHRLVRRAAEPG